MYAKYAKFLKKINITTSIFSGRWLVFTDWIVGCWSVVFENLCHFVSKTPLIHNEDKQTLVDLSHLTCCFYQISMVSTVTYFFIRPCSCKAIISIFSTSIYTNNCDWHANCKSSFLTMVSSQKN